MLIWEHVFMAKVNRNRHVPTPFKKKLVMKLAGLGLTYQEIARVVKISPMTLQRYYLDELKEGKAEANSKVAAALFRTATSGTREGVTAAIFWLKAQAGWKDRPDFPGANSPKGQITIAWGDGSDGNQG